MMELEETTKCRYEFFSFVSFSQHSKENNAGAYQPARRFRGSWKYQGFVESHPFFFFLKKKKICRF
jgi:hypothetical protein